MGFPAKKLTTGAPVRKAVLSTSVQNQIGELSTGLQSKSAGKTLVTGPSGTGKTLSASLLAKNPAIEVYLVDLPALISQYSTETEKNISALFEAAEKGGWTLLFDEADALFGKRTGVRDSHDKYANQAIAYLLQRIEQHKGTVVVVADEKRANIDEGFKRRMRLVINFPYPNV